MPSSSLAHALRLAADGQAADAVAHLEAAAGQGDADALHGLGLWRVEGRHLQRDLPLARSLIADAEARGSLAAARTLSAFLACGVGGPRDWSAALAVLDRWRDRDPLAARQLDLIAAMRSPAPAQPVSDSPSILRLPDFFTPDEIAFLLEVAEPRFKPALVFDEKQRRFVAHPYRDAQSAGFPLALEWPAIHALNRRIAEASGTDTAQGEPLQILRYQPGQRYRDHLDAVPALSNQRILTMLVALTDNYDGGETVFPKAGWSWRGSPGDALLFRNVDANERPDPRSLHTGAPVTRGTKQIASRWIRQRPPPPGESFGQHEVESEW